MEHPIEMKDESGDEKLSTSGRGWCAFLVLLKEGWVWNVGT